MSPEHRGVSRVALLGSGLPRPRAQSALFPATQGQGNVDRCIFLSEPLRLECPFAFLASEVAWTGGGGLGQGGSQGRCRRDTEHLPLPCHISPLGHRVGLPRLLCSLGSC